MIPRRDQAIQIHHEIILNHHEVTLNRHEVILNRHEVILNQADQVAEVLEAAEAEAVVVHQAVAAEDVNKNVEM